MYIRILYTRLCIDGAEGARETGPARRGILAARSDVPPSLGRIHHDSEAVNQTRGSVYRLRVAECITPQFLVAGSRLVGYRDRRDRPRLGAEHCLGCAASSFPRPQPLHTIRFAAKARSATARIRLCAKAYNNTTAFTFRKPRTRNRCSPRFRAKALTHSAVEARSR